LFSGNNFKVPIDKMFWQWANDWSSDPSYADDTCPAIDCAQIYGYFVTPVDLGFSTVRLSADRARPTVVDGMRPERRFATESPVEGDGFEPSVPLTRRPSTEPS
jgi:hypothetical protein